MTSQKIIKKKRQPSDVGTKRQPSDVGLLDFNGYCRFDTSAFFGHIKRGSIYIRSNESRSIKTKRQYPSKAMLRVLCPLVLLPIDTV